MGTARQLAEKAAGQIGVKESPAGSNIQKYGKWYGMDGEPWCDMFVSWCADQIGESKSVGKYAYCPYHVDFFKGQGAWLGRTASPKTGDVVFFANASGVACHVGIVEKRVDSSHVQTIEGNTSVSSNDNGGAVMRRNRAYGSAGSSWYILGFARPRYGSGASGGVKPSKSVDDVAQEVIDGKWGVGADRESRLEKAGYSYQEIQSRVNEILGGEKPSKASGRRFPLPSGHWYGVPSSDARNHSGYYDEADRPAIRMIQAKVGVSADGFYGAKTKAAVVKYQKANGLDADGEVGVKTWGKMFG